ncbi:MAG: hypothetical protein AAFR11_05655 [Pseudomonadota bacterium]
MLAYLIAIIQSGLGASPTFPDPPDAENPTADATNVTADSTDFTADGT